MLQKKPLEEEVTGTKCYVLLADMHAVLGVSEARADNIVAKLGLAYFLYENVCRLQITPKSIEKAGKMRRVNVLEFPNLDPEAFPRTLNDLVVMQALKLNQEGGPGVIKGCAPAIEDAIALMSKDGVIQYFGNGRLYDVYEAHEKFRGMIDERIALYLISGIVEDDRHREGLGKFRASVENFLRNSRAILGLLPPTTGTGRTARKTKDDDAARYNRLSNGASRQDDSTHTAREISRIRRSMED